MGNSGRFTIGFPGFLSIDPGPVAPRFGSRRGVLAIQRDLELAQIALLHIMDRGGRSCCNGFVIGRLSPYNFPRFGQLAAPAFRDANDFRLKPIDRPPGRKNYGAL